MNDQPKVSVYLFPQTWLGRLLSGLLAAALVVAGLFFLVFALIAGALIAAFLLARFWWGSRKARAQRDADVIEGTYTVEVESRERIRGPDADPSPPPRRPE